MPDVCSPDSLVEKARCLMGLSAREIQSVKTSLYCAWLANSDYTSRITDLNETRLTDSGDIRITA